MFRGTILRLLTMAYILRSPDESGGGGTFERPEHITEAEWDDLSADEREGLTSTDEGEGAHTILGTGEDAEDDEDGDELTAEELAAILADKPAEGKTAEELAAEAAAAGKTPDEIAAAEAAAAATKTPEEIAAEAAAAPEVTDADLIAYRPTVSDSELAFAKETPPEIQAKLDAIKQEVKDARAKFGEGDLTREALDDIIDAAADKRDAVNQELTEAKITTRDNQREALVWKKECNAFFAARKEYGEADTAADGTKTQTERAVMLHAALNAQIQRLNSLPGSDTKSGMQILVEADKAVRKLFNLPAGKPAAAATVTIPGKEKPAAVNRPALKEVSEKTLSGVPVAEGEHVDSMAKAVTRLNGPKFEATLENMTDAQRRALEDSV